MGDVCSTDRLGSKRDLWFDAPLVFASARLLNSGCGPKENDEFREWRGRDPDGDGARGIAKPVGGVAAIAARRIPRDPFPANNLCASPSAMRSKDLQGRRWLGSRQGARCTRVNASAISTTWLDIGRLCGIAAPPKFGLSRKCQGWTLSLSLSQNYG